ncbi:MAG: hypothetical protein M1815_001016 [Lichina confinis]|nr:MAG: hypothetical protein M1815_001016 [Lichina confinis]
MDPDRNIDGGSDRAVESTYDESIKQTLVAWNKLLAQQRALLKQEEKLRESVGTTPLAEPAAEPAARLRQLHIIKAAYEGIGASEPHLASPETHVPELLALRTTQRVADETRQSIAVVEKELRDAQRRLGDEQTSLRDAHRITIGLEGRLHTLRKEELEWSRMTEEQSAAESIKTLRSRRKASNREVKKLVQAFNWFIEAHLAEMLATEGRGGPVVGNAVGGINQESHHHDKAFISGLDDDRDESEGATELLDAVKTEMRTLTEQLLNASVSDEGDGDGDGYVTLQRDSAAVRFLVRAKIAQFSPRDARRLRLIDFGRALHE